MKKFNRYIQAQFVFLMVLMTGCGQAGVDPLSLLQVPFPALNSIVSGVTPSLLTVYSSSNPNWRFAAWGAISFVSPAAGVVSLQGADNDGNFVLITHSGRVATKISGLATVLVRSGDSVFSGQQVGVFANAPITFTVYLDRQPVCPLTFMSQEFRQFFFSGVGTNPCLP